MQELTTTEISKIIAAVQGRRERALEAALSANGIDALEDACSALDDAHCLTNYWLGRLARATEREAQS